MPTAEVAAGCRVIVMAKAPLPGLAKTRLIPALGAEGAARLAQRFLRETLLQALDAGLGEVELCGAPSGTHASMQAATQGLDIVRSDQGDGDLGQRMARALARALETGQRALLVGTDAPALDSHYLRNACRALDDADAVFGPAVDGGYALVGLRKPAAHLFDAMPWSTAQVMALTRERMAAAGTRWAELPVLYDVDEPQDLQHVPAGWL